MFPVANITPSCHNLQPVPAPLKGKLRRGLITECFILLEEGGSAGLSVISIDWFKGKPLQGTMFFTCFHVFCKYQYSNFGISMDFGYPDSFSCTRKPTNTTGLSSTRNPTPSSFNRSVALRLMHLDPWDENRPDGGHGWSSRCFSSSFHGTSWRKPWWKGRKCQHPGHMSQTHNSQQLAGATVISDPGSLHTKIPSLERPVETIPKLWMDPGNLQIIQWDLCPQNSSQPVAEGFLKLDMHT